MSADIGLLLVRIVIGLSFAAHGAQKLFGWFGGHGLAGTGGWFESMGFKPGRAFAVLSGGAEVAGGLLVLLGLFGPVGPALVISVMTVAILTVHLKNGFFAANNGYELNLAYIAGVVAIAFAGSGQLSLDAVLGVHVAPGPQWTWAVLGAGLVAGLLNLVLRRPPKEQAQTT